MLRSLETISRTFTAADATDLLRIVPLHALPHRKRQTASGLPADVRLARGLTAAAASLFLAAVGGFVFTRYNATSNAGSSTGYFQRPVHRIVPDQSLPGPALTRPARWSNEKQAE
jgi:hypothetical protein